MKYELGVRTSLLDRSIIVADANIDNKLRVKIEKIYSAKSLAICHKEPKNIFQSLLWIITEGGTYIDYKEIEPERLIRLESDMKSRVLSKDDFTYIKELEGEQK